LIQKGTIKAGEKFTCVELSGSFRDDLQNDQVIPIDHGLTCWGFNDQSQTGKRFQYNGTILIPLDTTADASTCALCTNIFV
jgi:hypothetical protein